MQLAAQIGSTPASPNPKVRAITGFVRLDASAYQKQIADAVVVLRTAMAEFESSGYEVERVGLTTQPLAELVADMSDDQASTFLRQLDVLTVTVNFVTDVGPEVLHDCDKRANKIMLD